MSDVLQAEMHGRVLRLTLNRAEKRNALDSVLCRQLVDAVQHGSHDPQVGAVVLVANGPVFSAGMDLSELGHVDPDTLNNAQEQLFSLNSRLATPFIVAVDGPALGGGMGLVANAHIVVASGKARFGLTEIRLGLWPFLVYRSLQIAMGERRVVELALTGRIFDAREAMSFGLVHQIDEDPAAKAMEIGEQLAGYSRTAVRGGLNFITEARNKDWEMTSLISRSMREELFQGPDFQEGIRAFREKRKPDWPSTRQKNEYPGEKTL